MHDLTIAKLNMLDRLKTIDQDYRNGPDGAYKRAWEIVEAEGYQQHADPAPGYALLPFIGEELPLPA